MNIQIPIEVFYRYEPPDGSVGLDGYLEVESIEIEGYSDEQCDEILKVLDPEKLVQIVEKNLKHERDESGALANADYISKWLRQAG